MFTIINFVVLYLITPYSLIPIIFEIAIILIQLLKYFLNLNVSSNIIGKFKVWILAFCAVLTFFISEINMIEYPNIYLWLLLPAIIMELLTFISYILEFKYKNKKQNIINYNKKNEDKLHLLWFDPNFYEDHKNDTNLKDLYRIIKKQ